MTQGDYSLVMVEELGLKTKDVSAAKREAMRHDYEDGAITIAEMAQRYGVAPRRIYSLRARYGWRPRRAIAEHVNRADVIRTLMRVLKRQVAQLDNNTAVPGERQAAMLAVHTRSLEKLMRMDKAEHAALAQRVSRAEQDRLKLIRRLAELGRT